MRTLCVDIGGTGIKGMVVGPSGEALSERHRIDTPRPATPERVLQVIEEIASGARQMGFERASVGFPGVVEEGIVRTAPNLDEGWADFPLAEELQKRLSTPVRAANDAGVQGLGAIEGKGTEIVITLGTGMGFGLYLDGRYVPNIELGHHPLRKGKTYEERVCEKARERIGNRRWRRRVHQIVAQLKHTFNYSVLYIGGGNARHLTAEELADPSYGRVVLIDNAAGLFGGVRLWGETGGSDRATQGGRPSSDPPPIEAPEIPQAAAPEASPAADAGSSTPAEPLSGTETEQKPEEQP